VTQRTVVLPANFPLIRETPKDPKNPKFGKKRVKRPQNCNIEKVKIQRVHLNGVDIWGKRNEKKFLFFLILSNFAFSFQ